MLKYVCLTEREEVLPRQGLATERNKGFAVLIGLSVLEIERENCV